MIYNAKLVYIDNIVEENIIIKIGNYFLTCFANICPYFIEVGNTYPVSINLFFIDGPDFIEVSDDVAEEIIHIDDGFRYSLTGILHDGVFSVGELDFCDENSFYEFQYLEGKKLNLQVDRLDVEFKEL
ncbi:hypothetical protein [Agrobacterium vitis]|uniref:hypothetical protein n=1 Tax=Agrobacterium vitis TaxID=373 RepID=UPI0012E799FA|nr:hypothetical protein [Agrobacterium vitis]MUZ64132.1 hypothetical protein [Agrobacterium vitis]